MSTEATFLNMGDVVQHTCVAAVAGGEVIQLPDGRAAVAVTGYAAGEQGTYQVRGRCDFLKTANIVLLSGQRAFWDVSASTATYKRDAGQQDFYLGCVAKDAAAADARVTVDLNEIPANLIDLRAGRGNWTKGETLGLGVTQEIGGEVTLAFDAVAEAAMAALYSDDTIPANKGWIFEAEVAVYDKGDAAALDISIGVASGTHATDFDSVVESALFHLDGNDLSVKCESDDGTTEVAATDTTVDLVDDTYALLQIDGRDESGLKFYVNGVRVLSGTTFSIAAAAGPLLPIVHLEKTSDDTVADVRVRNLCLRTCEPTVAA